MASNSTIEDTSLLEKGYQNETGEFTIHKLLHMHNERTGKKLEELTELKTG